jgi:hypothetical protein
VDVNVHLKLEINYLADAIGISASLHEHAVGVELA